ncbi:MAG: AAA family ATPase [Clostridia bacterium]|nr:AAA family ATPase [Clostridia bacterium]
MYISELTIKNYRNFSENEFVIPLKPFTAIIGENNIGKSNLLDSIGLIISQDITMLKKRMLDIEDINYKTKEKFKKQIADNINKAIDDIATKIVFPEVKVQIILDDMNDDQLAVVGDWFYENTLTKAKLTYLFRPRNGFKKTEWLKQQIEILKGLVGIPKEKLFEYVEFPIEQYEYLIYGGDSVTNKCEPYFLKLLKLEILDALRDAKKELVANGEYKILYRIINRDYGSDFADIQALLEELNTHIKENKKLRSIRQELVRFLNKFSLSYSGVDNEIDFNFSSPEVSEIIKKLCLIYGQEPISIDRNGLGKNNLLFISLILSQLASHTDNKLKLAFRVIGIEEPEAHLHPHLQKHLASNLSKIEELYSDNESLNNKQKDTQILITSHSTHVTTSLDFDNLVVLFRDGEKLKYHYLNTGFKNGNIGEEHIKYLKKYLDATNSCMFFARRIILVEGISEQILIPTFFKILYHKTLESVGCNVINVNGVAFKHFLEVVKNGYFIKCGVLTDKDKDTKSENRAESLKKEYDCNIIRIEYNEKTFEKEILKYNQKSAGKDLLIKVFGKLHSQLHKTLSVSWRTQIDVDEYFERIKNDKSDFAFYLEEELTKNSEGFIVPDYIKNIFSFVMED